MQNINAGFLSIGVAMMVLAVGAFQLPEANGQTREANGQTQGGEVSGKLWVAGGSTVRSWDCNAEELRIDVTPAEGVTAFTAGELATAVTGLRVRVPTAGLECDDKTMNGHMNDALGTRDHPLIEFRMESYRVTTVPEGGLQVQLEGPLSIRGETRPVVIRPSAAIEGDALRIRGEHTLNMTDFGVRPPRLMFGALRVHEEVTIHFDLLMSASAPADG